MDTITSQCHLNRAELLYYCYLCMQHLLMAMCGIDSGGIDCESAMTQGGHSSINKKAVINYDAVRN